MLVDNNNCPHHPSKNTKNLKETLPNESRKLAAIMFTDIKDFSKKMQSDEVATIRLLGIHNEMMMIAIAKHRGYVIKTIGDAFLVSFESVIGATQCAIEAQQSFYQYNQSKPASEKITVRIGVHLGDVFVRDNDVFGDGVNIASRIQSIAEPGGVSISGSVYDQVKNKLDIHVINLGVPQLKNIKEAIKVYQVIIIPTDNARGKLATRMYVAKTVLKRKRTQRLLAMSTIGLALLIVAVWFILHKPFLSVTDKTIAVLPFLNIGDPENEYYADGVTEDITTQLSKISNLLVITRASSFAYKASKLSDSVIARDLGVRFLLKGSLQLTHTNLKLTTTLTDVSKNEVVWEKSYDQPRSGIFSIEDQIINTIGDFFELDYSNVLQQSRTLSAEAFESYLRGLYHARKLKKDDNALAMRSFSESIAKDSLFVKAIVSLADAQEYHYEQGWEQSSQLLVEAEKNCEKALRLDPANAHPLAVLGTIIKLRGDAREAVVLYQKALDKDPNNPLALTRLAEMHLFYLNDPATAINLFNKLKVIEPGDWAINANLGIGYAQLKNYPEAIHAFQKSIQLNSHQAISWSNLGYAYERIALFDSAVQCYLTALQKDPTDPLSYESLVSVLLVNKNNFLAESVLTSGIRLMQNNHMVLYDLGLTYFIGERYKAAEQTFREGLQLVERKILKNPSVSDNFAYQGLFHARLGNAADAVTSAAQALKLDSTNNEILIKVARIYAALGNKEKMLTWFQRAKAMSAEYDAAYLATAIDFEKFRNDPDLLLMAKQE